MRYTLILVAAALAVAPRPVLAQDSLNAPVRAERLRLLIEQRFAERLREELGLSDEQAGKLRVAMAALAARRRVMEQDERRMRQALALQLRPGVAANADSVSRLVDAITNQRVLYAQTLKDEMRELSTILNPVQRGQYMLARDRIMQRVQEAIQQARPGGATRPPGRLNLP